MPRDPCAITKCAKELKAIEKSAVKFQEDLRKAMTKSANNRVSFKTVANDMQKVKAAFLRLPESKQLKKCLVEKCKAKPAKRT
jgi:hypothetical protein